MVLALEPFLILFAGRVADRRANPRTITHAGPVSPKVYGGLQGGLTERDDWSLGAAEGSCQRAVPKGSGQYLS
jgi:hypothetical protein